MFGSLLLMVFLEGSRFAKDWVPGVSEVGMASLRKVDGLVNDIQRRWPFARDTELKLP